MEDASPCKKWEQRWGSPINQKGLRLPPPTPPILLPALALRSFLAAAGKGWSGQVDVCVFVGHGVGVAGGGGLYSSGRMGGRLSPSTRAVDYEGDPISGTSNGLRP